MVDDLANAVRKIVEQRIREEHKRQQKIANQKKWEKTKPKLLNELKFIGATALLIGGLYFGSKFVNESAFVDHSKKIERRKEKIRNLQADSASYKNSIKRLEEYNKKMVSDNKKLENQIYEKKHTRLRQLTGTAENGTKIMVWKNGRTYSTTAKNGRYFISWRDKTIWFRADSIVAEFKGEHVKLKNKYRITRKTKLNIDPYKFFSPKSLHTRPSTSTTFSFSSKGSLPTTTSSKSHKGTTTAPDNTSNQLTGLTTEKVTNNKQQESSRQYNIIKLSGPTQPGTDITIWKNNRIVSEKKFFQENYQFVLTYAQPEFLADSVTGHLYNHEPLTRKNVTIGNNTILSMILKNNAPTKTTTSAQNTKQLQSATSESKQKNRSKKKARYLTSPQYRGNSKKKILKRGEYVLSEPIRINRGETLIINGGTKIIGNNKEFEIVINGGQINIKGSVNNPVTFSAKRTWEGILVKNSLNNEISNCKILNVEETDANEGGALTLTNSSIKCNNLTIENAYTTDNGGSIRAENSTLTLNYSRLDNGRAERNGGNIYLLNSSCDIINSTIFNGQAKEGGNIFENNTRGRSFNEAKKFALFIKKSKINNGSATMNGGGISIYNALIETHNTTGRNNSAQYGGFLYSNNGYENFLNSSFEENNASITGGGACFLNYQEIDKEIYKAFKNNSPNNVTTK